MNANQFCLVAGIALTLVAGAVAGAIQPAVAQDIDPRTLAAQVDEHLDAARRLVDQVVSVSGPRTPANTLDPLNRVSIEVLAVAHPAGLFQNVHPDPDVRTAAEEASRRVDAFITEMSLNRDVYDALSGLNAESLDPETRRLVEDGLADFKRAGVDKDPETRKKITQLREELIAIGQEFDRNLRDDRREIQVDPKQLEGLPEDYIANHPPDESGRVTVSTDYPDYFPVVTYAKDPEIRRQLYIEFNNRGYPQNKSALTRLVQKRHELAVLLGYASWADYITEDKMIESSANADRFVEQLERIAGKRSAKDYGLLLERKRRDEPGATEIHEWERSYYSELVKQERFSFDNQELRAFYNYPAVKEGMMDLSAKLFGVTFVPVPDAAVWHEDVDCYDLLDGGRRLGRFYLDMHPREGKFSHAACFDLTAGVKGIQEPQSVLVCNFPKPDENGLSLMEHDQVETFLHEFGHLLHSLFAGHHKWADQSGINMEWDFVEAPSQVLEEWALDPETLQRFARHYETGEPISAEAIGRLRRAREFGDGMYIRQQNFYSAVSLAIHDHDPSSIDLDAVVKRVKKKYSPYKHVAGTHMYSSFGHLNDYSAIYYTYMWSLVIAKDLFSKFDRADLMDARTAGAYRRAILDPGGTQPAAELVQSFLGRPFNFEAFDRWLNGDH